MLYRFYNIAAITNNPKSLSGFKSLKSVLHTTFPLPAAWVLFSMLTLSFFWGTEGIATVFNVNKMVIPSLLLVIGLRIQD